MRKEKITRTKEQEKAITNYIICKGFKNIAQFAQAAGMDRQNVWARVKGRTDPDIRMLMKWATILKADVTELIALFYPSEWQEYTNRKGKSL